MGMTGGTRMSMDESRITKAEVLRKSCKSFNFFILHFNFLFQDGEYPVACFGDEAISNSETKNTAGLAPPDSLLFSLEII